MKKTKKSSVLNMIERERHRVAANVTQEHEWSQHEPNNGLGRMFIVMLLIHVFVIGGIILYDFVGDGSSSNKAASAVRSSSGTTATTVASSTGAAVTPPLPTPNSTTSNASNSTSAESHLVVARETIDSIAAQHGVDRAALIALNQLDKNGGTTLQSGVRLALPPKSTAAVVPSAIPVTPTSLVAMNSATANSITPPPSAIPLVEPNAGSSLITKTNPTQSLVSQHNVPQVKPQAPVQQETAANKPAVHQEKTVTHQPAVSQPKPVPTPSQTRRALENDERKTNTVSKKPTESASTKKPSSNKVAESSSSKKTTSPVKKLGNGSKVTLGKGETLYSLARKYKTTPEAIQKANNIKDPTKLALGKSLVIP